MKKKGVLKVAKLDFVHLKTEIINLIGNGKIVQPSTQPLISTVDKCDVLWVFLFLKVNKFLSQLSSVSGVVTLSRHVVLVLCTSQL